MSLVGALGVALAFALGAVVYFAFILPRQVMRLVYREWIATYQARTESVALKQATAVEVAELVRALRAYHEEAGLIVVRFRAVAEWLAAFASAQYTQAWAMAVETTPPPDHLAPSRERMSPGRTGAPAIGPPGSPVEAAVTSAELVPTPSPELLALTSEPARRGVPAETLLGVGPLALRSVLGGVEAGRREVGLEPTMVSMSSPIAPDPRPAPSVEVKQHTGKKDGGS